MTDFHKLVPEDLLNSDPKSLTQAYRSDFESAQDFYEGDYRKLEDLLAQAEKLKGHPSFQNLERSKLSAKLQSYMRSLGAPAAALSAAKKLKDSDTFVVVTGQQPTIAGGPLLLLYKVAHCLALAKKLCEAGLKVVPVFWAASEDHDIDEVNRFGILNQKKRFRPLRIPGFESGGVKPLEKLELPDLEHAAFKELRAYFENRGTLNQEIKTLLQLASGKSFGRAINALLLKVFGSQGLVVLEPRLLRSLEAYKRIMEIEVLQGKSNRQAVQLQLLDQASKGFRPTLENSPYANFFFINRGKRRHVLFSGGEFSIDERPESLSKRAMLHELHHHPERFSAGVRLRPVIQGACLPVLASLVGPSEIAYHGALRLLFEHNAIPMPLLLPRWSYLLSFEDLAPSEVEAMRKKLYAGLSQSRERAAALSETQNELAFLFEGFKKELGLLARPLESDIQHITKGIDKSFAELKGRILALPIEDEEKLLEHARWLMPHYIAQERQLSWLGLWPEWGAELMASFQERDPFDFSLGMLTPASPKAGLSS